MLASFITHDRAFGEFVYYGMQVIIMSVVSYILILVVEQIRRNK